jgi:hypothetical protein
MELRRSVGGCFRLSIEKIASEQRHATGTVILAYLWAAQTPDSQELERSAYSRIRIEIPVTILAFKET